MGRPRPPAPSLWHWHVLSSLASSCPVDPGRARHRTAAVLPVEGSFSEPVLVRPVCRRGPGAAVAPAGAQLLGRLLVAPAASLRLHFAAAPVPAASSLPRQILPNAALDRCSSPRWTFLTETFSSGSSWEKSLCAPLSGRCSGRGRGGLEGSPGRGHRSPSPVTATLQRKSGPQASPGLRFSAWFQLFKTEFLGSRLLKFLVLGSVKFTHPASRSSDASLTPHASR